MCRWSETSTFGLCKAADVQRSGPGPGRRAHEAAQRQTQFLDHVLCLRNTVTSRRWRASSPSRTSPIPASLVKTRSRHTSLFCFSFRVSAIQNGSMYVLGIRQQRTGKSVDRRPVSFLCYALCSHLTTAADHPWSYHHSPFCVSRTSHMPSRAGSASASPLGSTSTAVCCASSTSNSSPAVNGRGSSYAACS